jgi:drug/metabolite transporter (DMT)-like permease
MPSPALAPARPSTATAGHAGHGSLPLLLAGLVFGTVGVFVHESGQPAWVTVWFRCVFGALTLLLLGFGGRGAWPLGRRAVLAVGGAGLLMVGSWISFFAALAWLPIGLATVLFHVQPLMLLAHAAAWRGERVSRSQWLAAGIALMGIALVLLGRAGGPGLGPAGAAGFWPGLALCLVSAVCYTAAALVARSGVASAPTLALSQCLVGAVVLAWVPWVAGLPTGLAAWSWLVGLGVVHTGLAYVLLFQGLRRAGTVQAALLQFVYPVAAVGVDWAVYGQALNAVQVLGLVLAIVALAAANGAWRFKAAAAP